MKELCLKHHSFQSATVRLNGLSATREILGPIFADRDRELIVVALCDDELRLMQMLSIPGTQSYVRISLPDILRHAIATRCDGFVLAHNHPSGEQRPSTSDLAITRRLATAADAMDLTFLDHLIFGVGTACSLRERGHL